MDELHKYVPKKTRERSFESPSDGSLTTYKEDYLHGILLGGDQLTCARARSCQRARMNADCASDALAGLAPCCEDWHTKAIFLSVSVCSVFVYNSSSYARIISVYMSECAEYNLQ